MIKNAIIEKGVITKIIANEGYLITDKTCSFFTEIAYVSNNYDLEKNPNNYRAFSYEQYAPYLDDEDYVPTNKVEELQQEINNLKEDRDNLEMILLNSDFRLTCMELKDLGLMD